MKKDLCQKRKAKLIFRGACGRSGTGTVECSEIIDVGCNRKQFDGGMRSILSVILVCFGDCEVLSFRALLQNVVWATGSTSGL